MSENKEAFLIDNFSKAALQRAAMYGALGLFIMGLTDSLFTAAVGSAIYIAYIEATLANTRFMIGNAQLHNNSEVASIDNNTP